MNALKFYTLISFVMVLINSGVSQNVNVSSGTFFVVSPEITLSVGNLNNSGTFIINSDASNNGSLIVSGTSSGNVTYNRHVTANNWHLVSCPVVGQDISDFTSGNSIATNGGFLGLAPYNNSTPGWSHYTDNYSGSDKFTSGKGYEVQRTADGTLPFTGTINTSDVIIGLTTPVSPGKKWNLIGNPFTAAINANDDAHATNNFITENTAALDDSYEAIYVWDAGGSDYITVNHTYNTNEAFFVAPGQAFFVYSVDGGGTVSFTEAMQTHQTGDTFKSGTIANPSIKLFAECSEGISSTNVKYFEGTTTGLDPGYDAGRFSGGDNSFAVYTHLVDDTESKVDFDIQCLPYGEFNHIVPVGLNAPENTEVVFHAQSENVTATIPVYLEDKLTGRITDLSEEGSLCRVTISEKIEGIGRFYLHFKSATTGISILDKESPFTIISRPQNKTIRIIGKTDNNTQVAIYDVMGRQITNSKLINTETNDVNMAGIESGVYIVTISSLSQKISKKISWLKNN